MKNPALCRDASDVVKVIEELKPTQQLLSSRGETICADIEESCHRVPHAEMHGWGVGAEGVTKDGRNERRSPTVCVRTSKDPTSPESIERVTAGDTVRCLLDFQGRPVDGFDHASSLRYNELGISYTVFPQRATL